MDAAHFRQRAARAREMAQFGDDLRISRMLLELAVELDAEAVAIEARGEADRPQSFRLQPPDAYHMTLRMTAAGAEAGGAADHQPQPCHKASIAARAAASPRQAG
ncbi:hypothetical protein [Rhodopila sp.]|uniref:hypothetical protein n=1 Tax=Rhodopila sp. TaxID=2480087 RepID=UPI003D0CF283